MTSFRQLQRQFGELTRCPRCGKQTCVANRAGWREPFRGEPVTLATHCSCPGGPAEHLVAPDPPRITDNMVVDFDGVPTCYGDLMLQDRHTVEWDAVRQCYVGGYPY